MTAAAMREFREQQSGIVNLAQRELLRFYNSLNTSNPYAVIRSLEEFLPDLVQEFGEIGAAAASDFYMELREEAGVASAHRALLGDAVPFEQSRSSLKWAVGPLFDENPDAAANNLIDITDKLVKEPGRNTIYANVESDSASVRYARIPTGADTCDYCLMLASRGAVYLSESSASRIGDYHNGCWCTPTAVWGDDHYEQVKSETNYNPDDLYEKWQKSQEQE